MTNMFNRRLALLAGVASVAMAGLAGPAFAEQIKIGLSQGTMNHPWRVAMVDGNRQYAKANLKDVDLLVTDGQNTSTKQVSDVESLLAQGIKVLMISPLTSDALTPVVKEAMDAGILVVTMDRKVNTPVTLHIGAENKPIGAQAAQELASVLGDKGSIVEIQGTAGASATVDRHDGFAEELAKHPGMKVIAVQYADYLREPALKFMEDTLQRFPSGQIQAVYAHNDEMALGAIQALESAGRLKEVKVVGIDGQNTAFEAVKAGKLTATFIYPFVAPEGIQYAYKLATGAKVQPEIILASQKVDAANIDQHLGKGF